MAADQTLQSYDINPANNHPQSADDGSNSGPFPFWQVCSDIEAEFRKFTIAAEWVSFLGISGVAVLFVNSTTFTLGSVNFTANWRVGRRVKALGVAGGPIYGSIATSVFSGGLMTVTVNWDGAGALDGGLTDVQLALVGPGSTGPFPNAQIYTGTTTGTDTYAVTLTPVPATLAALQDVPIFVEFINANTGAAATLAPNGLTATPIKKWVGGVLVALASGDIPADYAAILVYDGAQFQFLNPALSMAGISVLNRASGNPAVDVVNTNAETSVFSFAIPGNTIGVNQAIRLTLLGDFLNSTGGNRTAQIRVKFGGTTVFTITSSGTVLANSSARVASKLEINMQNLGATNAQLVDGELVLTLASNGQLSAAAVVYAGEYQGLAIDTTTAQTLQVTVQFVGAGDPNLEYRQYGAILELL